MPDYSRVCYMVHLSVTTLLLLSDISAFWKEMGAPVQLIASNDFAEEIIGVELIINQHCCIYTYLVCLCICGVLLALLASLLFPPTNS